MVMQLNVSTAAHPERYVQRDLLLDESQDRVSARVIARI